MIELNFFFPFSIFDCPWLAPAALLLDMLVGDPALPWPHPVCLLGRALNFLEKPARIFAAKGHSRKKRKIRAKLAGASCLFLICLATWGSTLLLCQLSCFSYLFALYLAWAGLAGSCLISTGKLVLERIENGSLIEGREACSWLVSRHTGDMDRCMLRKTLADTIAENYTDAFAAPWLWLCLGGPCALWIYKVVSTMDSQWGYLTPRWAMLGHAGARADDFLAWLAARLSAFLFFLTDRLGYYMKFRCWTGAWPGYGTIARQARTMPSPNSGWSMASCAWLCHGRMAGPSIYFGKLVGKGWLGPEDANSAQWNRQKLETLFCLSRYAMICGGIFIWLVLFSISCALEI